MGRFVPVFSRSQKSEIRHSFDFEIRLKPDFEVKGSRVIAWKWGVKTLGTRFDIKITLPCLLLDLQVSSFPAGNPLDLQLLS